MKLEKWKTPDNYFGDEWYDYYVGLSRHRDSDTLTESNFITFLQRLGGESKTVFIVRESHWAVGWIEWIAIHKDDKEALGLAEVMFDDINDYPVLDDDDFSQREWDKAETVWNDCFDLKDRIDLCKEHNISIFAARHKYIPQDDNGSLFDYLVTD